MRSKLLLVEDDENFGSLLQNYLSLHGFDVTWRKDGTTGYSICLQNKFDLCILDIMMPKMDGLTLGKKIKEKNTELPIIYLTAKNQKEDIIEGYQIGADDYITKPFDTELLILKIKAVLNRIQVSNAVPDKKEIYEFGQWQFKPSLRKVTNSKKEIKLSPKEAMLLEMLCMFENKILPRELALKEIWGEINYFTKRSMDVYITKLRKIFTDDQSINIETFHQHGFQLTIIN